MKKKSRNRTLIILLSVIASIFLLIIGSTFTYSHYLYSKVNTVNINRDDVLNENNKQEKSSDIINIGLFGVDRVDGDVGLSDCNMILTINNNTNQIKVCSIMRDTLVNIPDNGTMIINHAMLGGGPQLMLKTINQNFNLTLDTFVSVNLNTLPQIIDKLGGIEMTVENNEFKHINNYIKDLNNKNSTSASLLNNPGKQLLNGTQATAYARVRYTEGSDFRRTQRQRDLFTAMAQKLSTLSISNLNSFVNEVLPLVSTNLSYNEILSIGTTVLQVGTSNIQQNRFPNDGDWSKGSINGNYGLKIDMDSTTNKIHDFIYN